MKNKILLLPCNGNRHHEMHGRSVNKIKTTKENKENELNINKHKQLNWETAPVGERNGRPTDFREERERALGGKWPQRWKKEK
jgi:hypothetical protein